MKRLLVLLVVTSVLAAASTSEARRYGGGGGGASTAESAAEFGAAAVIRSQGMANAMNAQAAIGYQQAYSLYLQNRLAATQTYFEMRQMNRQYRAQEAEKPATKEEMAHYSELARPKQLSPSQLDPVSGLISWPLLLRDDAYATYRDQLQSIFTLRAQHQEINYHDVLQAADAMQQELKKHISDLAPQDFETSHKFIDSLAYEAHNPAG